MQTALITGANKSIGWATARLLLQNGYHVFLGARSLENGLDAVERLKTEGLDQAEAVQLDVTDIESVRAARKEVGARIDVLDVLVNNAGISGGRPQNATEAPLDAYQAVFDTNLFGVVRVTQTFIDLMRGADNPRIVMVSSSVGSLTLHNDPTWKYYDNKGAIYHPSKAALNMYTIDLAYELRDTAFKVNAVDPGFVATDFNNHRGTGTVEEAGERVAEVAMCGPDGPTGRYISREHDPGNGHIPW